jgi:hypothetical protein
VHDSFLSAPSRHDPYQRSAEPPLRHCSHTTAHHGVGLIVGDGSSVGLGLGEGVAMIDGLAVGVAVGLGVGVAVGVAVGGDGPTTGGGGPIGGSPGGGGTMPGAAVGAGLAFGLAEAFSRGVSVAAGVGEPVFPRTDSLGVGDRSATGAAEGSRISVPPAAIPTMAARMTAAALPATRSTHEGRPCQSPTGGVDGNGAAEGSMSVRVSLAPARSRQLGHADA